MPPIAHQKTTSAEVADVPRERRPVVALEPHDRRPREGELVVVPVPAQLAVDRSVYRGEKAGVDAGVGGQDADSCPAAANASIARCQMSS